MAVISAKFYKSCYAEEAEEGVYMACALYAIKRSHKGVRKVLDHEDIPLYIEKVKD